MSPTLQDEPVFTALADPTRRAILELLEDGPLEAGAIASTFPISKPAKTQMHVSIQKRLHEKAPFFGIVSSQTRMWFVGRNMLGGTIKLKLMEIGKNAESQLPKW